MRGWDLIIPGCGGTLTLPQEGQLSPCAGSLSHANMPIINQPVEVGFPHLTGRYRHRGCPFLSPGLFIPSYNYEWKKMKNTGAGSRLRPKGQLSPCVRVP